MSANLHCRETRTAGTAINTFFNLLMTFAVGQTFLSMLCAMKFGVSVFGDSVWGVIVVGVLGGGVIIVCVLGGG